MLFLAAGCARPVPPSQNESAGRVKLSGGGASFPYPLYSKWIEEYKQVGAGVVVDYQSIGSGGGIRGITEGTLDFAGSDAPMTPEERARAPREIVHLPVVLGAVAVTYNLPGNPVLNLDGETLADIYLGRIIKWNHPRLQALNPGVALPDQDIAMIHRSDGSGTTFVFTDYLSGTSSAWRNGPGTGKSVSWPLGIGGKGNEGVTGQLKLIEGSIGYVELAYAVKNNLPCARLKNRAGRFVGPATASIAAAAADAARDLPPDLCLSLVNAPGAEAYPLSTFSYLLVYREQADPVKGKALAEFLWWAVHEGQRYAEELLYTPLPEAVVARLEKELKTLTCQGKPLLE
jgi:phosphate transport system substrate-binding protein